MIVTKCTLITFHTTRVYTVHNYYIGFRDTIHELFRARAISHTLRIYHRMDLDFPAYVIDGRKKQHRYTIQAETKTIQAASPHEIA
jgi:hypothetical protein